MKFQLSGMVNDSIVDGPGLRLAVFMQGCPHRCPGCHNPESWYPSGGREADTQEVQQALENNPLLDGLTLSGGEPFSQPEAAARMAEMARARGLSVWAYTGWTLEALLAMADPAIHHLLGLIDVLVDGPFVQAQCSLELPFRGSSNQRLINLPATLAGTSVVLWTPESWS